MHPYPMCHQTVTLYRREEGQVVRQVLPGCFYRYEDGVCDGHFVRRFLLIRPGVEPVYPGDRVFDGIGPETVNWEEFLPVTVPGLSEAYYAAPWYWMGKIAHWEAGRK